MANDPSGAEYRPRVIDDRLDQLLGAVGAVVLEGPKQCGKTWTGLRHAASSIRMDSSEGVRQAAEIDPAKILNGQRPRLIDEWQLVPALWNAARHEIDKVGRHGQFILTGSSLPGDDITRHSGAGRFARLHMRPFSLSESGHSSSTVSLAALLDGSAQSEISNDFGLDELIDALCRGGWPASTGDVSEAMDATDAYLEEVTRTDLARVENARIRPAIARSLLMAWARSLASPATLTTIARDMAQEGSAPDLATVRRYVTAFERLMIIEDQPSWRTSLRSRARLRQGPKRHFVDPSIAVSALKASPSSLVRDAALLGMLFESLVVRDLRVYAVPLRAEVMHYRDNTDLEIDAIVQCRDGRWGACEVKLSPSAIDRAAGALTRFAAKVDTSRVGDPSFLAVITATGPCFRRKDDGVWVVPLSLLGP